MEEKLRFVYEYERDEETMRELCDQDLQKQPKHFIDHGLRDV